MLKLIYIYKFECCYRAQRLQMRSGLEKSQTPDAKHLTLLEAMNHVKLNFAPLMAQTFTQGLATGRVNNSLGRNTITAYKLGEIELSEEIGDTTLFLRQITVAMYPPTTGFD